MTLRDWRFEGTPASNATAALIVSTPSGLQAASSSAGTGNPAHQFSAEKVQDGDTSIKMVTSVSTAGLVRLPFYGTASPKFALTLSHYTDTTLLAALTIANVRGSTGTASGFRLAINTNGSVFLASSTATVATTAAGVYVVGQWHHFEIVGDLSTGAVTLNVYRGSSRTSVATIAGTYVFTTEGNAVAVDIGTPQNVLSAQTGGMTHWFDSVRMDDGRESPIPFILPASSGNVSVLPGAGSGGSGWTVFGGAADEGTALNDGNSATGIESPDITSTANERKFSLAAMVPRSSLTLTLTGVALTSGSASPQVRVYVGSTLIATKSLTATTTPTTRTVSLTTDEVAAITAISGGWENLVVGIRTGA
jgi:hypothetical protein